MLNIDVGRVVSVMSAEDDCRDNVDELALGRSLLRRRSLRQQTHNTGPEQHLGGDIVRWP